MVNPLKESWTGVIALPTFFLKWIDFLKRDSAVIYEIEKKYIALRGCWNPVLPS